MRALWIIAVSFFVAGSIGAAEDFPRGKLPDTVVPIAYRIDLTVVPEQPRFSGHVEIDAELKRDAQSIFLHGRDLKVGNVAVLHAQQRIGARYTQLDPLGTARVDFDRKLPAGKVTLIFDYDAPFGNSPAGLYRINVANDWYAWTQFQSIDARAAFPSFDEPGFKTPFAVSLTTQPGLMAISNAPEKGGGTKVGELVKHTFEPTLPLPTYLIAFVVGPFVAVEGLAPPTPIRKHPLPVRIVATKNQAGRLDYALAETRPIVELLEKYFGTPFPFPKLDQIASPVMGGAMENAGADIYDDEILLLDKGASTRQKQVFGMVVAHELAHQWFGDLVTPAWWDDIWLNESFANWMGYRIGNEWRPELNIGVNAIDEALTAMGTDSLVVGRPIHQKIVANGEIDSAFDKITYGKGGQVVAMIASYLGDEKFRDGVRLHLERHPYGNATSDEFFTALADAGKDPRVLKSMQSFVYQQGVPVIDLQRDGAKFKATQARYALLGARAPDTQWIIPFCVRRDATRSCTLLENKVQSIAANGTGTLVPNAGGTGYYRYSMSPADWDQLLKLAPTLPAGEALAASDSLWAQFDAGRLPASHAIKGARAFVANADSNVAVHGGDQLAAWRALGWIPSPSVADYERTIKSIYADRFASLGFQPRAGAHANDTPDRQKLREELVELMADEARDANTRKVLRDATTQLLAGQSDALDQTFYRVAMRTYVQDGNLESTQRMLNYALESKDQLIRTAAVEATGMHRRAADARWVLTQFNDPRLRSTEKLELMGGLMSQAETRDIAFEWLKANYDEFAKGAGIFAATAIPTLPGLYCSEEKAQEIDRVLRPKVLRAGRGELPFNRMLENIRTCAAIKQAKSAEIAAALR